MINEAKKSKPIVVTIGRFQPMTGGHELLMKKVMDTAKKVGGDYRVYTTYSKGDASNPLTHPEKVRFMRKQIPGLKVAVDKDVRTPFDLMQKLSDEGWKEVYLVLGGSRVPELRKGIGRYIPSKYKFEKFTVVSAGQRDPDADDATGISGTKVREMVKKGHKAKFRKAMPSTTSKDVADSLFKTLRKKMGLKEDFQLDEVMSVAQKRKRSIIFKRLAPRIRRRKEMMRKRRKTSEQLRKRAYRAAKRAFRNRLLKGKNYYELGFTERIRIDQRLAKIKKTRLKALATRLFPVVVKKERERFQSMQRNEERDYKAEYEKYHSKPEYRADRGARVQARRDAEAAGRVSKGDGKDIDHINGNARDNSKGNTRVVSASTNRGRKNNSNKYTREEHGAGEEGTDKLVKKYKKDTPGQPVNEVYRKSGLGKWFHGQSAGGDPGWDRYNTKGEKVGKCGDSEPGEGKPKCLSRQKAAKLRAQGGKKAIANAVRRKREKDPVQDRPGTGNKPVNVSNRIDKDPKKKGIQDMKSFDTFLSQLFEGKNKPTNPKLWASTIAKAKSKFDVYPSAYANAWAAKEYKKAGGGWTTKESVEESFELKEQKFSTAQLSKLKQEYGKLKTVDPGSPTYKKLTTFLDGLSTEQLKQIVDAKIPFLRGLALNRVNRRKMNEALADRRVIRQRNPRSLEKKTTNISLVLPGTPEMKAKMKKILGFSANTRNQMAKLVAGREDRGKDLVLYFKSARSRKKFQDMLNAKSDWTATESVQEAAEKDHEYSMARSQLSTIQKAVVNLMKKMKGEGNLEAWVQSKLTKAADYIDSVSDYIDSGEHDIEEDWQKVNRQDKTDGLSQKAVKAYRRENPGSKLQTAVTKDPSKLKAGSKDAKRRASFCRRMKGMKQRLTSAETANDPDSRINKALRRWNC